MFKFDRVRDEAACLGVAAIIRTLTISALFAIVPIPSSYAGPIDSIEPEGPTQAGLDPAAVPASADVAIVAIDRASLAKGTDPDSPARSNGANLRAAGDFALFNARHQNRWKVSFDTERGHVKSLYGALSRPYQNGPEGVAKGFLAESRALFGLKADLSDLVVQRVDRTPDRDHVRLQQTHDGIPVAGAMVLIHATPRGQVSMVQNAYVSDLQVANGRVLTAQAAVDIARDDLQAALDAGAVLSAPKAEELVVSHQGRYVHSWQVSIATQHPWGFWVYRIDAENGNTLYKADELVALRTGIARGYRTNADWRLGRLRNYYLKGLYGAVETAAYGYLRGPKIAVMDNVGNDPWAPNFRFMYDPVLQKDWFDAAQAYYKVSSVRHWWVSLLAKYRKSSDFLNSYTIPVVVNVGGMCNAFYHPELLGEGAPGLAFGDERSCSPGSEDLAVDEDIVRHEMAHGMMDWLGFDNQFGGPIHYYGRAMGEGNADWFAFIRHPRNPKIAEVAWSWSANGYLRNLDNTRVYPRDVDYPGWGTPEEHYTGEIWGGYLNDLYRVMGRKALPYVFNALYYFSPAGGHMDGLPDMFDAILAQINADHDLTGGRRNAKAWGSMAARGLNGVLRPPYSHDSDYFGTGMPGEDALVALVWSFPPATSVRTSSNLLNASDRHEYLIAGAQAGRPVTVTVTSKTINGIVNPSVELRDTSGNVLAVGSGSATTATLTYASLPTEVCIVVVTGSNSAPGRGYYALSVAVK